jgi:hypothetical protein
MLVLALVSSSASKNKRKHPRLDLFATVELSAREETVVLRVRNLSLGGVSLGAGGKNLGRFADGMVVDVLIFDAEDASLPPVRSPARVLRHDPDGSVALTWNATDPRVLEQLASLLDKHASRS